jgi:hypothetical protein
MVALDDRQSPPNSHVILHANFNGGAMQLEKLSDKELLTKVDALVWTENNATAQLLLHLAELDKRESYVELGYTSLYDYMVRKLRYSEGAAVKRITAARCVRDFPEVHELDATYDAVMNRDGLCCSYVAADGTKCESKIGLQLDHIVPFGKGGGHDGNNLRVLCAKHNRLAAKKIYGAQTMSRYCKV